MRRVGIVLAILAACVAAWLFLRADPPDVAPASPSAAAGAQSPRAEPAAGRQRARGPAEPRTQSPAAAPAEASPPPQQPELPAEPVPAEAPALWLTVVDKTTGAPLAGARVGFLVIDAERRAAATQTEAETAD